jgi:hypothetical protein
MSSALKDTFLYAGAALFAAMGLGSIVAPNKVTSQFGIPRLSVAARNEVRAVYGGFGLLMSGMLVAATQSSELRRGAGLTITAALLGMALGRVLSAVMDRALPTIPLLYLVAEVAVAAMIFAGI